jgi:glycosyltransferase involved in cell wall biosynthesis
MEGLEGQYRWEIIIVNDGSTDDTGTVAETCANCRDNIYVLHHPYNFRLGQALRFAFSRCRGDFIVVMDIDLSYSPDHIERMAAKIIETKAKIVIASPYMKGGRVSNVPWFRSILSRWANRYLCLTVKRDKFSDKITTMTGMVRTYDRMFLSRLNLKAMDVDINPEIIYKAMILRARIVEVPAHLNWSNEKAKGPGRKTARKSSLRVMRATIQSLISGFMFRPFMFFVIPGVSFVLLSLYPIIYALLRSVYFYHTLDGVDISDAIGMSFQKSPHAFLVGGFVLIVGIQLFNIGLMALQSKRYFEEMFHINSSILAVLRESRDPEVDEKIMKL